ncbi:ABC transporter permease [Pseudodesulfovibrio sediminis]|uniref:ABC transporter permease n=1 Tax=Pseudodesulfovibrio sediminis TaxID=2810563 RepID=A0ABM7P601_9BACT|nr:ABC transporter permease [Pseudodesulfovibrio sediminis]BCS88226.1 ABC transporter permease [Pseudodesulfovibrio sediminis]
MGNIFKIALRNLTRYKRRTMLTSLLIIIGVCMVVLFSGLAGSFKNMMIGIITDSSLGHIQVHKKGYVSSIDTLPLNMNLKPKAYQKLEAVLLNQKGIEAYAPRIKFGSMLSNYAESTSVRISAIAPDKERKVCTALHTRLKAEHDPATPLLKQGEVIIPERIARAMKIEPGAPVVLVATNKDGSVNGMEFVVAGLIEDILGPGGKDAYMHIDDARKLLRTKGAEVTEIVLRAKPGVPLKKVVMGLRKDLEGFLNKKGKPAFEVHTWEKLSPFSNIAGMIDLMIITVKIIMIAIVLISVLNVMLMSVFERIREIGTIAAMGTLPSKILALFVAEGFLLGLLGTIAGLVLGLGGLLIVKAMEISFTFGRMPGLMLRPEINVSELLIIGAIVLFASALAALQPAWKASKMEPVDALGHV